VLSKKERQMGQKIVLSEPQEFGVKALTLTVYPLGGEKLLELTDKLQNLEKLQNSKDLKKIIEVSMEVVYEIIHDDNPTVTMGDLLKNLSLPGAVKIVQFAMGTEL
jgi:hypothetical protein